MEQEQKHSHRHFLVIPIALVLCVAPFMQGALQGSLLSSPSDDLVSNTGFHYMLLDGAEIEEVQNDTLLKNGSILIGSEGLSTLRASESYTVTIYNGAAHVSRYGDIVSVAALKAPLLLEYEDRHMVIPAGRQWRSTSQALPSLEAGIGLWLSTRKTKAVPEKFLRDQLHNLDSLELHDKSLPEPRVQAPIIDLPDSLELPVAEQRSEEAVIAMLRGAIELGDAEAVQSILDTAPDFSKESRQHISVLLTRSASKSALSSPLVSIIGEDRRVWLLMSMHADFSSLAWTYGMPKLSNAEKMTALFFMPTADVLPKACGQMAVEHWGRLLEESVLDAKNPSNILNSLLVHAHESVKTMEELHYPERARWYVQQAVVISVPYEDGLSIHAQKSFYALSHWEDLSLEEPEVEEEAPEEVEVVEEDEKVEDVEEEVAFSPDVVEAQAYAKLEEHKNFLFTVETRVVAISPNTAQVVNIVVSSPGKDRVFSFLLDTEKGVISELTEGDKEYPFNLALERFMSWALLF